MPTNLFALLPTKAAPMRSVKRLYLTGYHRNDAGKEAQFYRLLYIVMPNCTKFDRGQLLIELDAVFSTILEFHRQSEQVGINVLPNNRDLLLVLLLSKFR